MVLLHEKPHATVGDCPQSALRKLTVRLGLAKPPYHFLGFQRWSDHEQDAPALLYRRVEAVPDRLLLQQDRQLCGVESAIVFRPVPEVLYKVVTLQPSEVGASGKGGSEPVWM